MCSHQFDVQDAPARSSSGEDRDEAAGGFSVDIEPVVHPGWTVISVSGELDHVTAPMLWAFITSRVDPGVPSRLVLDLAGVGFCNVAGLRVLQQAQRRAAAAAGQLTVRCRARGPVDLLLRVSGAAVDIDVEHVTGS